MPTDKADGHAAASIDELPSLYDGLIKLARTELEITAFGVQVMDLPPDYTTQSHDEADSGQQELYVGLRGEGAVLIGDQRVPLAEGRLVRVDPGVGRILSSGPSGLRVLCIGSVPGGVYTPPDWTSE
jgi:uncharacterized cupin superfamily protein